jgi:hypothetical protein
MGNSRGSLRNLIKTGFGLGIGVYLAQLVFFLIGLLFFFPGYIYFKQKQKDNAPDTEKIIPFVFMIFGVVIMGGVGFQFLIENGSDFFD